MAGQVFAIASGKGGVGKTTTVVNLGVVLRRADHSVALVDADLGMANLGSLLGVSSESTLHDVLAGRSSLEDALVEEAPGFAVLVGSESLTDYPEADPEHLGDLLETLAESYDFVLVDTGAGMSHEDVLPLGLADRVILVASPDPAAVGDTRKTAELAGLAAGDIVGLVVTKADPSTDARHVAAQVGVDLLGVIPYDPTVRESTASGRPLEAVDSDTPAATAYRELANAIADGSTDPLTRPTEGDSAESAPADEADSSATVSDSDGDQPDASGSVDPEPEGTADDDELVPSTDEADEAAPDDGGDHEQRPEAQSTAGSDGEPEPAEAADDVTETDESDEPDVDASPDADETPEPVEPEADAEPEDEETSEPVDPEEKLESEDEEADETAEVAADADSEDDAATPDDDDTSEEEDPLAEFEDDEPQRKGGLLSRIGRLFR